MFAALIAATCPPACDVHLSDMHRFGVCQGVAECNRSACSLHLERIVKNLENENARMAWWWRQDTVFEAWDCLRNALDADRHVVKRMDSLSRLRVVIGEEAYYAGRMPSPIPNYGVWMPVK